VDQVRSGRRKRREQYSFPVDEDDVAVLARLALERSRNEIVEAATRHRAGSGKSVIGFEASMMAREGAPMSITEDLAKILAHVDRPGDFYVVGRTELLAPRIEVEGVGLLALPLLAAQAKRLIKVATRAPYGRGAETVVDTKVRRTWQIEASRVVIGGKHWAQTLAGIVARAVEGLGVTGSVAAALYKLLIYDKGSFFVSHRDTEKVPGMFATLVLTLPSQSEGGELVVRHKDRQVSNIGVQSRSPR
jgi:hypothetical protein